jgi:predicted transcriptional regulator
MAKRQYDLGAAELDVLTVLWEQGPLPVRQVMNHLHRGGRRVAYTTVQTLLTRLEQKGYVQSDRSDLAYVFRAKLSQERVRKSRLKSLVRDLYDGTPAALALHLIQSERFSPEEIAELRKLIDRLDPGRERPRP